MRNRLGVVRFLPAWAAGGDRRPPFFTGLRRDLDAVKTGGEAEGKAAPGKGAASWVQCSDAPSAPRPVCERTYWAGKAAISFFAWALLSVIENSQVPTKAMVIENSAGLS